ncbi:MAG: hypothetical protein NTV99_07825 [Deltaproteobacteria bacterium]|nr:hypothetical protein [Deltaproteobacteria bacterium]
MAKARKGDTFTCDVCGLVVAVDETGDCAVGEIICCEIPMKKGKALMKAKKKVGAKKVAKKKPAKKVVKKAKAKPKKKVAKKKK